MSQQNKYIPGPRLPSGGALSWDMTKLTDEQLQYEYDLCYEILYGIYVKQSDVTLPGLLDRSHYEGDDEQYELALKTWKARFERAKHELVDRQILS